MTHNEMKAIRRLHPEGSFVVMDDGKIVSNENPEIEKVTKEQINAEVLKIEEEDKKTQYQRDRKYPRINEQLDLLYWDKVNGTNKWQEAVAKVKAKYPKPE